MRHRTLDAVVSAHLANLRARRGGLDRIVGGRAPLLVPTLAEQAGLEREITRDDLALAGLAIVARLWSLTGTSERPFGAVQEARVLVRVRATAAVLAVALAQVPDPDPGVLADLEALRAAFRHVETSLDRFAPRPGDEQDDLRGRAELVQSLLSYARYGKPPRTAAPRAASHP